MSPAAVAPPAADAPPETGSRPALIAWQCSACGTNNTTRTRKGQHMRCPACGHVQLGPEAQREHEERLAAVRASRERRSRTQRASSAIRARIRAAELPPPAAGEGAGDEAPPNPPPVAPPPPPPPRPPARAGLLDRLLGYA